MHLGPFHFTGEVSLGSLLTFGTVIWASIKYLRHFVINTKETNERMEILWFKFNGLNPDDEKGWFYRFKQMERKVNEMWDRLQFNRIHIDETHSRSSD